MVFVGCHAHFCVHPSSDYFSHIIYNIWCWIGVFFVSLSDVFYMNVISYIWKYLL